jgi:dihydrofolate reductase
MGRLVVDISVSLDGFVAGPNQTLEDPLGENGEMLHDWVVATKQFRDAHGGQGGEDGVDDEVGAEHLAGKGASIMGRRMYSSGHGPWENDPKASGWWGDDPPFHHPVFVLTHHAREPLEMKGGTTFHFVTDGIESALERARAVAGDQDISLAGGAQAISQGLKAGLLDEMQLHVVPIFLGAGARLFHDHVAQAPGKLRLTRVVDSPTGVVHLKYEVAGRQRR